jgi:hypothetical protein
MSAQYFANLRIRIIISSVKVAEASSAKLRQHNSYLVINQSFKQLAKFRILLPSFQPFQIFGIIYMFGFLLPIPQEASLCYPPALSTYLNRLGNWRLSVKMKRGG